MDSILNSILIVIQTISEFMWGTPMTVPSSVQVFT